MKGQLKGKIVLVTGGAGFIGSNLVSSLLDDGNTVFCLDNFSTGKRENIARFLGLPHFRLIEGDIRNIDDCRKAVAGTEIVFQQAALGSVPRSLNDPVTTNDVNIGGFVRMLQASREAGVRRFIYAASSSTYGDNEDLPKTEDRTGSPLSPYAVTKYANELYAGVFALNYGMTLIGLRYFNVYGPFQDPAGAYAAVIPKFAIQLMRGERPVINGDGSISRDFTHVDNVVAANYLAAAVDKAEAFGQVFNVACGEATTITRIFEIIRTTIGRHDKSVLDTEPVYGPERQGDIKHSLASVEKARRLLGYKPVVSVEEGLPATVEWFRNNMHKMPETI